MQSEDKLQNINTYNYDIKINNMSLTGIKEIFVFNEISYFYVAENYSVDIMHDLLEGVYKYNIELMLNKMIFNIHYFTVKILNDRIQSFNYVSIDIRSRRSLISVDSIKSTCSLKMSASLILCIMRYLSIIIGDLVPENSELWQIYIIL